MNPETRKMKSRIRKSRVKTRVRCLECDHVVMTTEIGQLKFCKCKKTGVWQHPDGYEILTKNDKFIVLEVENVHSKA